MSTRSPATPLGPTGGTPGPQIRPDPHMDSFGDPKWYHFGVMWGAKTNPEGIHLETKHETENITYEDEMK